MNSQQAYEMIERGHIMAGMRGNFTREIALNTTGILMRENINVFEVTMNSYDPIPVMEALKAEYGDDACVGMGTVLDAETALRVLDAGADFVVSPAYQADVVDTVMQADVLMAPGVITPSEAVAAWQQGVKLLKLFPIGGLGLDYFKAIRGPLNHMNFMCNGAMHAENAHDFIKAGAVACGMSAWLTGDGTMSQTLIQQRAHQLQHAIRMAQGLPREI